MKLKRGYTVARVPDQISRLFAMTQTGPERVQYTVQIASPSFANVSVPKPEPPAKVISCTCGASVRKALPGYVSAVANGCELTRGEREYCEQTGKWPTAYESTNCRGKSKRIATKQMYLSKRDAILRGEKVSPTLLTQEDINFFHVDDLNGSKYGDPEEWDDDRNDESRMEPSELDDQYHRKKAESSQDIDTILANTCEMRSLFNGDGANKAGQMEDGQSRPSRNRYEEYVSKITKGLNHWEVAKLWARTQQAKYPDRRFALPRHEAE
jgi:hypothetical protein